MKIANIAPPWIAIPPKNYGGTEIVIFYLIEEQILQGHEVTLFAPGDARTSARHISFFPESLVPSGVPWQAPLKAFYHFCKSIEYIKDHKSFDIVHAHLSSRHDMLIFPLLASLATPHVVTLHGCFPFDFDQKWVGDADKLYMDWAPSVPTIAVSESARSEVPYNLNFVGVVHHGIPTDHFIPTVQKQEDFFVWLGRFIPEKGAHIAIEAARRANVPIVLAGTVDHQVPESVDYFTKVVNPLIDSEQVKYIGPVNMEQKIDLLSRAYGFLNPIQWEEPFGMVMIEAMALGCPVISFARGAAPELIIHGKTGFLAQNIDEMVSFIQRINEIDRKAVRSHIQINFSSKAMAQKYTKIYQEVIRTNKKDFAI